MASTRIESIDALRALIMLLMLWVNDFAALPDLPHWLGHADTMEDMMGFSDIVFPGFLFCVGMSIPLAVRSRERRGHSTLQIVGHVLSRSLSLVVMGLFTLNACRTGLSMLLTATAFALVWLNYRRMGGIAPWCARVLQGVGILLLLGILLHHDATGEPFRTGWWGILGLIGWAYLAVALLHIFTRHSIALMMAATLGVVALSVINAPHMIPDTYFSRNIFLPFYPGGWTHPALVAAGAAASVLLTRLRPKALFPVFGMLAVIAFGLFLACHQFWIISKNLATPTWAFLCLSIFAVAVPIIHWITDVRRHHRWFALIAPAGTATLTCYLLPYFADALRMLFHVSILPASLQSGVPGLIASFVYALIVIQVTRLLIRLRLTLKL